VTEGTNEAGSESKVRDNSQPVSPMPVSPDVQSTEIAGVGDDGDRMISENEGDDEDGMISESEIQLQQELSYYPASYTERSDGINPANIISGSRSRKPRFDPDYASYLILDEDEPPAIMHAFGEGMNERYTKQKQKLMKLHRDQLPPEPQNWHKVKKHKYAKEFADVARFEIETLRRKETFS
jgi:hypothetical protein